jgi:hypothetical protein
VPLCLFSITRGHHLSTSICELWHSTVTSLQVSKTQGSTKIQAYLLPYGHRSTNKSKYVATDGTLRNGLIVIGFSAYWLQTQTRVTAPMPTSGLVRCTKVLPRNQGKKVEPALGEMTSLIWGMGTSARLPKTAFPTTRRPTTTAIYTAVRMK